MLKLRTFMRGSAIVAVLALRACPVWAQAGGDATIKTVLPDAAITAGGVPITAGGVPMAGKAVTIEGSGSPILELGGRACLIGPLKLMTENGETLLSLAEGVHMPTGCK